MVCVCVCVCVCSYSEGPTSVYPPQPLVYVRLKYNVERVHIYVKIAARSVDWDWLFTF